MIRYGNVHKTAAGVMLASLVIFIWGVTFVCTKTLLKDFSALEILFYRFLAAYGSLWLLCPHKLHTKSIKQELLFFLAGLCGVTLYQFLENTAIMYTSASNVSIIVSICPIFTAITAQLFLHEKHITPMFVIGFIIAITGVAFVSFNGTVQFHFNPRGDLLALLAAMLWGFYSLAVSKINKLGFSTLACTRRIFFWALMLMIPLMMFGTFSPAAARSSVFSVNFNYSVNVMRFSKPVNWGNILFLGFAASAFCFAAWSRACDYLGTVRATIGIYLIPVVTVLFAYFALGEQFTLMGAAGAACTIAGLVISGL
jgi:drug/metabolite transporter (DMT)-like permease